MSHDKENGFETNEPMSEQEFAGLAQALRENRPAPDPEFTERLDQAVADHFPPEWADEASLGQRDRGIGSHAERFRRWLAGNRTLIPTLAGTVGVLFIAAVVVINANPGSGPGGDGNQTGSGPARTMDPASDEEGVDSVASGAVADSAALEQVPTTRAAKPARQAERLDGANQPQSLTFSSGRINGSREVAREAEITLGTDPDGIQDAANQVIEVTDEHNGIVMDSKVTDGEKGEAGATFSLLIPVGEVESAVADLSAIADLRSRSQELTDITAPVKKAGDAVSKTRARIRNLSEKLEQTFDETERARIERNIRWQRQQLGWYEARVKRLERRVEYTPVALKVETSGDSSSDNSAWGLADAFDDAGRLLGIAAGVTVVALAVAIPIGLVILIALALNRAWVRRSRRRILADDD